MSKKRKSRLLPHHLTNKKEGSEIVDFRWYRYPLPDSSFAHVPEERSAPLDPINIDTWKSLVWLTDNVILETTDDFGKFFNLYLEMIDKWMVLNDKIIQIYHDREKARMHPIISIMLDCFDHLQASCHNAIHGFYREGFSILRNLLESIVFSIYLEIEDDTKLRKKWFLNEVELRFGTCVTNIYKKNIRFESIMYEKCRNNLLGKTRDSGYVRKLYYILSSYVHGKPNYANNDLWDGSNGPIYVYSSFVSWINIFLKTYILCFILLIINIKNIEIFKRMDLKQFLNYLTTLIPEKEDAHKILKTAIEEVNI